MNGCAKPNCFLLENVALTSCKEMAHNFYCDFVGEKPIRGKSLLSFFLKKNSKLAKFFFVEKHTFCAEKTCFSNFYSR
jgi:hypothetical protein